MTLYPSSNYDERQLPISMIVLHYTGMTSAEAAYHRLCDAAAKVSAHYLIDEKGKVIPLVDEAHRAWHAGESFWRGIRDVNSASIGIEIANPGHEHGYLAFTMPQIAHVVQLCQQLVDRHGIAPWNIVGHSDIAPLRKMDPGELFPWQDLVEAGVGTWPQASPSTALVAEAPVLQLLSRIGYDPAVMLVDQEAVVRAFQRRFLPHMITGLVDDPTIATIRSLAEQVPVWE